MRFQRLRTVLRWTLRAILALALLLVLFILEENIRGHILLARYQAELRAKGEKLTLEELDLPHVPLEGNGTHELLEAADELMALSAQSPLQAFGLDRMKFVAPGCAIVLHRQERLRDLRPGESVFERGRRRPSTVEGKTGTEVPPSLPPPTCPWSDLAALIKSSQPALAKAKHALQEPTLGIELDYTQGWDMKLPHLNKIQASARWLAAASLCDLHETNTDAAIDDIAAIAVLTRFSKPERVLVSQLVRANIGDIALQTTWEALQSDGWTESQLTRLQAAWESTEIMPQIADTIEAERALMGHAFDKSVLWLGWKDLRNWIWSTDDMDPWEAICTTISGIAWRLAWVPQDKLRLLQRWQRAVEFERRAMAGRSWMIAHAGWDAVTREDRRLGWSFYDDKRYVLSGALGPESWSLATRRVMRFETQRQLTLTAIALKRYELVHGRFPEQLDKLVPQQLAEVPRDYMDGQQLRYRMTDDDSFVLYSVGENGVDDGGDPTPLEPRKFVSSIWDGCDAVWPAPTTQEEMDAFKLTGTPVPPSRRGRISPSSQRRHHIQLNVIIVNSGAGAEFEAVADFVAESVEGVGGTEAAGAARHAFALGLETLAAGFHGDVESHNEGNLRLGIDAVNYTNNNGTQRRFAVFHDLTRGITFINHQHAFADSRAHTAIDRNQVPAAFARKIFLLHDQHLLPVIERMVDRRDDIAPDSTDNHDGVCNSSTIPTIA